MKKDIYQEVTTQIIEALKNNVRPWVAPYDQFNIIPKRSTGEYYQGINLMLLMFKSQKKGYTAPHWFTYNQAFKFGANVKKGEKGTRIIFYKTLEVFNDETGEDDKIPMLKTYNVFNADQIEGLPDSFTVKTESRDLEPIQACEAFFESVGAKLEHKAVIPNYAPMSDTITCPGINNFKTPELYYATLGHEFAHWTGAEHRLDRLKATSRHSPEYYFEELIAEISAGFLMPQLGIEPLIDDEHVPYIKGYLELLENDEKLIFKAAAQAQKAVDFLIDQSHSEIIKKEAA